MSETTDFFGDVFDDPEDDPLLGDESTFSEGASATEEKGAPSWMSRDESDGAGSSPSTESQQPEDQETAGAVPEQKEIVVDQRDPGQKGLEELNEAVGQGWRLVRISLTRPGGQQAASREEAERFVAVLEQESPQSLFDFGAP